MKKNIIGLLIVFCLMGLFWFYCNGCTTTSTGSTTTTTSSVTSTSTTTSITTSITTSSTTTTNPTHQIVGTWVGTWEDSYAITGCLEATIAQNGNVLNGTGFIGLAGLNPQGFSFSTEVGTATGTLSAGNITFAFSSSPVGYGSGTIIGNLISGSGDVTAFVDGEFIFVGTIEAGGSRINGFFDFTSPSAGNGTAILYKQ